MKLLKKSQITRVYSGRPGCMCGCRGNYSTSPTTITKIYNKFLKEAEAAVKYDDDKFESPVARFVYWKNPEGTRTYTIYFDAIAKVDPLESYITGEKCIACDSTTGCDCTDKEIRIATSEVA